MMQNIPFSDIKAMRGYKCRIVYISKSGDMRSREGILQTRGMTIGVVYENGSYYQFRRNAIVKVMRI